METKKQPEMSCLEFLSMTDPTWGVQSRGLVPAFKPGDPTMLGQPHLQPWLVPWLLLYFYTEGHWLTDGGNKDPSVTAFWKVQAKPSELNGE